MIQKTYSLRTRDTYANTANAAVEVGATLTTEREATKMTPTILTPDRLRALEAVQGSRGVLSSATAKACLFTQATYDDDGNVVGNYYVDIVGETPSIVESVKKDGTLTYGDDDGNFSLSKLYNAAKTTIDRKRKDALAAAADAGTPASFPNVVAVQDDDAGTVYIVNFDAAPEKNDDDA